MDDHALTEQERIALERCEDALARHAGRLDDAVAEYNAVVAAARRALERAADGYNAALAEARALRDAVVSARAPASGPAGEGLQDFLDEWRGASLEDVELPERESMPHPDVGAAAELHCMPVAPEVLSGPSLR